MFPISKTGSVNILEKPEMDSLGKDTWENVVQGIDNLQRQCQSQQDLVLQLKSQFDHMLSYLSSVVKDLQINKQAQDVHNSNLDRVIEFLRVRHGYDQSAVSDQTLLKQASTGPKFEDVVNDFQNRLNRMDENLNRLVLENKQLHEKITLISQNTESHLGHAERSQEIATEISEKITDKLDKVLLEVIQMKGQNTAEFVFLGNRLDTALSDITKLNDKLETVNNKLPDVSAQSALLGTALENQRDTLKILNNTTKVGETGCHEVLFTSTQALISKIEKLHKKVSHISDKMNTFLEVAEGEHEKEKNLLSVNTDKFEKFLQKTKEDVSSIQISQTQIQQALNRAVEGLKQHLDSSNSAVKREIQTNFRKQTKESEKEIKDFFDKAIKKSVNQALDGFKNIHDAENTNMQCETMINFEKHLKESDKEMKDVIQESINRSVNKAMEGLKKYFQTTKEDVSNIQISQTQVQQALNQALDGLKKIHDAENTGMQCETMINFEKHLKESDKEMRDFIQETINRSVNQVMEGLKQVLDMENTEKQLETLTKIDKHMKDFSNKLKEFIKEHINKSLENFHKRFIETTNTSLKKEMQSCTQNRPEGPVSNIIHCINETKCQMFTVIEKESQLVRDFIEANVPLNKQLRPHEETYTFDFCVQDLKSNMKSKGTVKSCPWHIKKFKSSVHGVIEFNDTGEMLVLVKTFRRPLEVGLQPRSVQDVKVRAEVIDTKGKVLDIGEAKWNVNEKNDRNSRLLIGKLSCDDLLQKEYGEKEGYTDRAILIRYTVNVP